MPTERKCLPIGESLQEQLHRLESLLQLKEEETPSCSEMGEREVAGVGNYHFVDIAGKEQWAAYRVCPKEKRRQVQARLEQEFQTLSALLEKSGCPSGARSTGSSISRTLFAAIDQTRSVKNIQRMLLATQEACKEHPPRRNLAFLGPSGLAKTTCQLVIHFARLEAGIDSYFVDSIQLRDVFRRLNSYNEEVVREAERTLQPWLSAQSMIWSDVGDTTSSRVGEFSASLSMLLERSSATWVISSNLSIEELKQHPDIGPRAVSRLLSDRNGIPAQIVGVLGEDQRWYHQLQGRLDSSRSNVVDRPSSMAQKGSVS